MGADQSNVLLPQLISVVNMLYLECNISFSTKNVIEDTKEWS